MWLSVSDLQGLLKVRHAAVSGVKRVLAMRFMRTKPKTTDDQLVTMGVLMETDHRLQVRVEAFASEEGAARWIEAALRKDTKRA